MTQAVATTPTYEPDQLRSIAVEVWIEYPVPSTRAGRRHQRARAEWFSGQLSMATRTPTTLAEAAPLVAEIADRVLRELARNPLLTMTELRV